MGRIEKCDFQRVGVDLGESGETNMEGKGHHQDWEVPVPKAVFAIPSPEASFAGVPNAEDTGTVGWSAGFPREKPGVAAAGLLPCETGAPSEKAGLSVLVPFVIGGKEKPEKAAGFADGLDDAAVVLPWVFGAEIF